MMLRLPQATGQQPAAGLHPILEVSCCPASPVTPNGVLRPWLVAGRRGPSCQRPTWLGESLPEPLQDRPSGPLYGNWLLNLNAGRPRGWLLWRAPPQGAPLELVAGTGARAERQAKPPRACQEVPPALHSRLGSPQARAPRHGPRLPCRRPHPVSPPAQTRLAG